MLNNEQDKELNRMVLHTESFAEPLPSLFEPTAAEIKKEIERHLVLAYALGIITVETNPQTGERFEAFCTKDEVLGNNKLEKLGKSFQSTLDELSNDFRKAEELKKYVSVKLKEVISNDQKKQIRAEAVKLLDGSILLDMCGGNMVNPIYDYYRKIVTDIFTNELREL